MKITLNSTLESKEIYSVYEMESGKWYRTKTKNFISRLPSRNDCVLILFPIGDGYNLDMLDSDRIGFPITPETPTFSFTVVNSQFSN